MDRRPYKTLRTVLLKVLLPLAVVGGSVAVLIVLHLDGTLRMFLDQQSMLGMMAVVLVLNVVGFAFIYMLSMVWKSVKHDLLNYRDPDDEPWPLTPPSTKHRSPCRRPASPPAASAWTSKRHGPPSGGRAG